ncbi:hypothetical protein ZOSMA_268G00110 [Zostera marina]|uniref:Uncharacterized protein n=1 Tax=Zostera marina TaxID=29655 RepID=A0A0K9PGT0_ZOSMR|nr:hypothetical protein ZOSMA_268G00110 [Zostera marina]
MLNQNRPTQMQWQLNQQEVIAPDEDMKVSQHEIEPEEELEVTDEIPDDNNDEIPDDMPLSVYMPKVRKGKGKPLKNQVQVRMIF